MKVALWKIAHARSGDKADRADIGLFAYDAPTYEVLKREVTRERGLVNIDTRKGTNRFDTHIGLQEAFVEAKLRDLSPNYDFVSVRAGIQQFTSDFRLVERSHQIWQHGCEPIVMMRAGG